MEPEDSYMEFPLMRSISTPVNSFLFNFDTCAFKTAEEEMVNYFYKSLLRFVVEKSETSFEESVESIPSGERKIITPNLTYTQVCDEEELLLNEVTVSNDNILESGIFHGVTTSKRRNTSLTKRDRRLPRRKSNKSRKRLHTINHNARTFSSLITPSQLKYRLDDLDLEEFVKVKYRNGNTYNGPLLMKLFHGVGEYRWSNGTVYKGDFADGDMVGNGKFTYPDLSTYEGEVYHGYPHGFGKYFLTGTNLAYEGNWHLGQKQGTGTVHFDYNDWYEGTWNNDRMEGTGIRCYPSGSKYQGEFSDGLRHGNGCALLWNNDFYDGAWANGFRDGYGQYIWGLFRNRNFSIPVLKTYNGMWKFDFMHGKGDMNFGSSNGARYIGHFCYNQKHGDGVIICENGAVVESYPMFIENKPLQYSELGNIHTTECEEYLPPTPIKSKSWIAETYDDHYSSDDETPTDLYHLQFSEAPEKLYPTRIPWALSPEDIDINPYIRVLLELIHDSNNPISETDSVIIKPNSWQDVGVPSTDKPPVKYNYHEIYEIEEKALKRAIQINLRRLRQIYKQYSLIGCMKNMPFETIMNRLFLWQMFRDCKISEKGVSISQIDVLLAEGSFSLDETIHDPFENIYFWQFLTSLVRTSWEIYGNKTIKYVYEGRSILEEIFTKFLNQDIFPHVGHHTGTVLFDYKDLIPIKAAYNWFKSIEEPMSIKTLIMNIFSKNKNEIYKYEPHSNNFFIKNGTNISMGNNIIFLEDEEPKFCVGPGREKIPPLQRKCLRRKLYFLHDLNLKLLYKKIQSVVPGIFTNKECFNHDYKLCFLEFYEIILTCTQHILKKKELTFKKKYVTKISENSENVVLKTVQTKKSKQYRKSASHHSMKRPVS